MTLPISLAKKLIKGHLQPEVRRVLGIEGYPDYFFNYGKTRPAQHLRRQPAVQPAHRVAGAVRTPGEENQWHLPGQQIHERALEYRPDNVYCVSLYPRMDESPAGCR